MLVSEMSDKPFGLKMLFQEPYLALKSLTNPKRFGHRFILKCTGLQKTVDYLDSVTFSHHIPQAFTILSDK